LLNEAKHHLRPPQKGSEQVRIITEQVYIDNLGMIVLEYLNISFILRWPL
jgi:hypothetical protein